MRITWKDAITTLSAGGAVVAERAYFHEYDWPLASSMRWVIGVLAILAAINLVLGFAFDWRKSDWWDFLAIVLGVGLATITTLGLIYVVSDYVVLGMLATLAIWLLSVARHLAEHGAPHTPHRFVHA